MFEYILRLFILVPFVGGLAYASLWMWRRAQTGMLSNTTAERSLRIIDAVSLGTSGRLVVVEFCDRPLLLSITRTDIKVIADKSVSVKND
jgi:flagellar protein FliO/FliZ